jgi:hypothetical protein
MAAPFLKSYMVTNRHDPYAIFFGIKPLGSAELYFFSANGAYVSDDVRKNYALDSSTASPTPSDAYITRISDLAVVLLPIRSVAMP